MIISVKFSENLVPQKGDLIQDITFDTRLLTPEIFARKMQKAYDEYQKALGENADKNAEIEK